MHAYFNSVYRVLEFQPYSNLHTGVYGFYGILLAPVVKILGGDFWAFVKTMVLITIITVICCCYVLDSLVKKQSLRILGSIGIITAFVSLDTNIYYQLFPHRLFNISVMLAYLTFMNKHNKKGLIWRIFGIILGALAVVWNFETGIGCVLAFSGSYIVFHMQCSEEHKWKRIIYEVICIPIELLVAYGMISLYNVCCGGGFLTLSEFLFPIIGNTYVNNLNIELGKQPCSWMLVCALFYIVIMIVLLSTNLCGKGKSTPEFVIISACVISAAIQMIYFVNRSVWGNLFIVLPASVILMCWLIEHIYEVNTWKRNDFGNGILRGISVSTRVALVFVVVITFTNWLNLEQGRETTRNTNDVCQFAKLVESNVPQNTLAIGAGLPEIYSILGWDTGFYGIDMSDIMVLDEKNRLTILEIVLNSNDIVLQDRAYNDIMSFREGAADKFFSEHIEVFSCTFGEEVYRYYKRI